MLWRLEQSAVHERLPQHRSARHVDVQVSKCRELLFPGRNWKERERARRIRLLLRPTANNDQDNAEEERDNSADSDMGEFYA